MSLLAIRHSVYVEEEHLHDSAPQRSSLDGQAAEHAQGDVHGVLGVAETLFPIAAMYVRHRQGAGWAVVPL